MYGLLCLPYPSNLKKPTKILKVIPSCDPSIYLSLKEGIKNSKEKGIGHIMVGEIKLIFFISFNCNNNKFAGFVIEQLNTKNMFESIFSLTKKKKELPDGYLRKLMAFLSKLWFGS